MIVDGILFVIRGLLSGLLAPLEIVNVVVDIGASIPVVGQFLSIVAYVIPWSNVYPIIVITGAILGFKIAVSLIEFLWDLIPFM